MVMGQASQHNYSAHMSTSLALGFLFMAGGAATFSTSPQATAALVIALFPRFPHSPTDHRCHLQVCASCSSQAKGQKKLSVQAVACLIAEPLLAFSMQMPCATECSLSLSCCASLQLLYLVSLAPVLLHSMLHHHVGNFHSSYYSTCPLRLTI